MAKIRKVYQCCEPTSLASGKNDAQNRACEVHARPGLPSPGHKGRERHLVRRRKLSPDAEV